MRVLASLIGLLAVLPSAASAESTITQADLLRRVIDLERLTTPPHPEEHTGMCSSYDRHSRIDAGGQPVDWGANQDWGHFYGRRPDGWSVMAELEGPGVLTRIWSANPHGALRVVLDGEIVLDTTFDKLLSGELEPLTEPLVYRGLNCYYPIGFNSSCHVLARDSTAYYQINYVRFPRGTQVQRFALVLDAAAQAALAEVKAALEAGFSERQLFGDRELQAATAQRDLGPGDVLSASLPGAGTVRALYVGLTAAAAPRDVYALHRCVLRIFFDGETAPAVAVPLVDFFGSGFYLSPMQSLVIGTDRQLSAPLAGREAADDRFMYCYFPMPYRKGLRVEIENMNPGEREIGLLLQVRADSQPPASDALRFHAGFRKEDPCQVLDYAVLEAPGPGRLVGCLLNVDCPRHTWWGEGDDKMWIDGERFPSYFGTGTEDYLGDAWGIRRHIRPLQGVTRTGHRTPRRDKNSAYRWHVSDCVNFQESIRFSIENWQFGGVQDTYYSTIAYWYAAPGGKRFFQPLTLADLTPPGPRISGAVEIEGHVRGAGWGTVVEQSELDRVELSGGRAVRITSAQPVQVSIPAEAGGRFRLKLHTNPREPFEAITVAAADGRTVGTVRFASAAKGLYTVGVLPLEPGENLVTVQCSPPAMLDCWALERLRKNACGPEAEDLKVVIADGVRTSVEYAAVGVSAGAQLTLDFSGDGQTATLALPDQPEDAVLTLRLRTACGPDGGRFQTLIDDQFVGDPVDCYAGQPDRRRFRVAAVTLSEGAHTLGFCALKPDSRATGQRLGLDFVDLFRALSPYAIECEDLPIVGDHRSRPVPQGIGGASGEEHIFCRPASAGAWIEFELPVPKPGAYRLAVVYTRSGDYGLVQAYVNGRKAGVPVDTYAPEIVPGLVVELGTFELPAEPLRLRFEVVDTNDVSPGYFFGTDCVIIEPTVARP